MIKKEKTNFIFRSVINNSSLRQGQALRQNSKQHRHLRDKLENIIYDGS